MKKYLIIAVPCLIAIIAASIIFGKKEPVQYKTEKVERGNISKYVVATGTINPVRTVIIGSQVSGLITKLYADFNSVVSKGQVVAQIDPVPFEHKIKMAEAALATARATLEKETVNAKNTRMKYRRARELFAKKVISIDEYDEVRTTYEVKLADVKLAEAQVMQTKAALEIAKTDLAHTVIASPLDGIVISRTVDVGQTVAATFQTPTLFTIAKDLVHMQVNTNVDEADIGMVKVGQDAKFTVDAFSEDIFNGKVMEIRMSPIIFQNVVTYDTLISVDNSSLKLKPGMTANTSILVSTAENVLKIPNAALRYTPSGVLKEGMEMKAAADRKIPEKGGFAVWVLNQGKTEKVIVKPGVSDDHFTEVTEGTIKEGQEVIVAEIMPMGTRKDDTKSVPWRKSRY